MTNEGVKAGLDTEQIQRGIQLAVKYFDKAGKEIEPEILPQGTDFIAAVTVKNTSVFRITNIALSQLFPAGWEIVNSRMFESSDNQKNSTFDYRDIRDDRVYTYFGLEVNQEKTFLLNLNASYCGDYLLAPVTCEAMYDNTCFAKVAGKKVKVKK